MIKLVVSTLALGTLLNVVAISSADARHRHHHKRIVDANGNTGIVVSHKTGAKARVGVAHVGKFQAYIDELEDNGAIIHDMGGVRRGRCSSGHMHPCGKAIDLCQLRRGVVSPRCRLPDRDIIAVIAAKHGLFEGGLWCDQDYGHAQVGWSAPICKTESIMLAKTHERKVRHVARSRSHATRVASNTWRTNRHRYKDRSYQEPYSAAYQRYGTAQGTWGTVQMRRYSANQVRRSRYVGGQSYYAYYY